MERAIKAGAYPAMGDIRQMGPGDTLWLESAVRNSPEWCRYGDAVRHAVSRGADVRWVR